MIVKLTEEMGILEKQNEDQKDELDVKVGEIERLVDSNKDNDSSNSLSSELYAACSQPPEVLTCDHCNLIFKTKADLTDHKTTSHEARPSQKLNLLAKVTEMERETSELFFSIWS